MLLAIIIIAAAGSFDSLKYGVIIMMMDLSTPKYGHYAWLVALCVFFWLF